MNPGFFSSPVKRAAPLTELFFPTSNKSPFFPSSPPSLVSRKTILFTSPPFPLLFFPSRPTPYFIDFSSSSFPAKSSPLSFPRRESTTEKEKKFETTSCRGAIYPYFKRTRHFRKKIKKTKAKKGIILFAEYLEQKQSPFLIQRGVSSSRHFDLISPLQTPS